jgi:hypothetical protein
MLRISILSLLLVSADSAHAFVARGAADIDLPGKFETACVQLMMDIDMYWHYTIEGESFAVSKQRVVLDKTNSYDIPILSPNEAKALSWIEDLHATALLTVESVLENNIKKSEYMDIDIEDIIYASLRRGIQESMYQSCRTGVYLRLNSLH